MQRIIPIWDAKHGSDSTGLLQRSIFFMFEIKGNSVKMLYPSDREVIKNAYTAYRNKLASAKHELGWMTDVINQTLGKDLSRSMEFVGKQGNKTILVLKNEFLDKKLQIINHDDLLVICSKSGVGYSWDGKRYIIICNGEIYTIE